VSERAVAIVTGAASGIGAATARELAADGAAVVLASLPGEDMGSLIAAVEQAGGEALAVPTDVRNAQQCEALATAALERFGRIDLLVANAGIADQTTAHGGDPDRWRRVLETNLLGAAYSVRAVLPSMLERRSGHIVLVASVSGREAYVGEPIYIASKWGLVGYGHALRQEVASANVRVTLIEPGLVDTPLTRGSPTVEPLLRASAPLRPEDVARVIAYAHRQPANVAISEITVRPFPEPDLRALAGTTGDDAAP
jgi:NADP-dependent 3-hydroxy acid dehydrogenase YdfG